MPAKSHGNPFFVSSQWQQLQRPDGDQRCTNCHLRTEKDPPGTDGVAIAPTRIQLASTSIRLAPTGVAIAPTIVSAIAPTDVRRIAPTRVSAIAPI